MCKIALQVISLVLMLQKRCSLEIGPVVTIKHGMIRGSIIKTFDKQIPYQAFLGIPYAKPPVEDLRFKESQNPEKWSGVLNTTSEKDICMQPITTIYGTTEVRGSEDCLYLNVYTPVVSNNRGKLPVMFFVHGGGFIDGSKNFEEYGPDLFINNGVILIVIQYRLGVFGFLSTKDDACPGNNGLKDQVLALRWAKENVRAFGGDPNKITIFGHSAGAACIGYILQTKLSKGLFRAAIMQSASMIDYFARGTHPVEKAFELGRKFEIFTNDSTELINKLRSIKNDKSLYSIANDVASKFNEFDGSYANYGPTIEHPHKTAFLTKKPLQQLLEREFHKVPIIIGHTTLEAQYFKSMVSEYSFKIADNITLLIPNTLIPKDEETTKLVAEKIKEYYFKNTTGGFREDDVLRYVSDNMFVRGILKASRLFSRAIPVYQYTFAYIGNLGNAQQDRKGVGHTEELNYIFHKTAESQNISKEDDNVRQGLVRLWTNFAKTGNPTPRNSAEVTWPILKEREYKSLFINGTNSVRERENEEEITFWNNLYKYDTRHVGWY